MRTGNGSIQDAHLSKYRAERMNQYAETHRNLKAYKQFKHIPDYGKGKVNNNGCSNTGNSSCAVHSRSDYGYHVNDSY